MARRRTFQLMSLLVQPVSLCPTWEAELGLGGSTRSCAKTRSRGSRSTPSARREFAGRSLRLESAVAVGSRRARPLVGPRQFDAHMIAVLSLTLLGFFLGMRHATDADHVIAVSTIVTRQPTIRAALLIGSLWGVGHTLTIVAVGGAIVLFTIVIPPRLGLTMEMAVALMLIVLGMWNLTGFLEQIGGLRSIDFGGAVRL